MTANNNWYPNNYQWITITTSNGIVSATPVSNDDDLLDLIEPEKKKLSDGETCKKCKEFYPYAEPNQNDGTLVCYSCRHGY